MAREGNYHPGSSVPAAPLGGSAGPSWALNCKIHGVSSSWLIGKKGGGGGALA